MLLGGPRRVPTRCSRQIREEISQKDPGGCPGEFFWRRGWQRVSGREFSGGPRRVPGRKWKRLLRRTPEGAQEKNLGGDGRIE